MTDLFFAEANSYAGLRDAFRARIEELSISRALLDELTGLPSGYCGKLLAKGEAKKGKRRPKIQKRIGPLSLDVLLPATGLKLLVVDDRPALAKIASRFVARDETQVRLNNGCARSKGRRIPKASKARARRRPAPERSKPYLAK